MVDIETISQIRTKYESLAAIMDEKVRRHWAATEATALGWGGISAVAEATGLSRNTILAGIKEVMQGSQIFESLNQPSRVRVPGGGRKPLNETDRRLQRDLEKLLDFSTRGDPQSPLKWTSKSSHHLGEDLRRRGHQGSDRTVIHLLHQMKSRLQANRKTKADRK